MAPHQHFEMGLSFPAPFRKAPHTLPTPPTSPQAPPKTLKRLPSRFRLPRLLKKISPVELTATTATEVTSRSVSSSFQVPEGIKQMELAAPTGHALHVLMQRPLLALPTAPALDVEYESLTKTPSRKLRKMTKSYRNLRSPKSDHQLISEPIKSNATAPALLPSPLLSDGGEDWCRRNAHLAYRVPQEAESTRPGPAETSYDYENIVAGYCENVFGESRRTEASSTVAVDRPSGLATPSHHHEDIQTSPSIRTPPTSNMSATLRSPQRDRSSSLSSEATWLSKSFANQHHSISIGQLERIQMNEKRLAEKSRRCCHLVQAPNEDMPGSWTGERMAVSFPEQATSRGF